MRPTPDTSVTIAGTDFTNPMASLELINGALDKLKPKILVTEQSSNRMCVTPELKERIEKEKLRVEQAIQESWNLPPMEEPEDEHELISNREIYTFSHNPKSSL